MRDLRPVELCQPRRTDGDASADLDRRRELLDDARASNASLNSLSNGEDSQLGLTFGFGVKGKLGGNHYRFDYAWAGHEYLDDTHRLTMVVEF